MTRLPYQENATGRASRGLHLVPKDVPERCRLCSLRGAALCHALRSEGASCGRPGRLRRVSADEMLFEEGRDPDFMGVLRRGYLRQEKLTRDGRRTLLQLARPGDIVGGLERKRFSLEAATDAEICTFDLGAARRLSATDGAFRRHMLREAALENERQMEMNWQRGALTSRERIFAFLVAAAGIMPSQAMPDGSLIVTIELARQDWAGLSNTTVETVSRTMTYLAEKDLVTKLSPTRYRIRNLEVLADLAGIDAVPGPEPFGLRQHCATDHRARPESARRLTLINETQPPRPEAARIVVNQPRNRGSE